MTQTIDISKLELTSDPLKNIQIMAPLLSKDDQNKVYGMLFGILCKLSDQSSKELHKICKKFCG